MDQPSERLSPSFSSTPSPCHGCPGTWVYSGRPEKYCREVRGKRTGTYSARRLLSWCLSCLTVSVFSTWKVVASTLNAPLASLVYLVGTPLSTVLAQCIRSGCVGVDECECACVRTNKQPGFKTAYTWLWSFFFFFQLRPQQTCPASFIILRECAPLRSKHLSFKDIKSGTFCLFSYPWGC